MNELGYAFFYSVPLVLFFRIAVLSVVVTMTDCLYIYLFHSFFPVFLGFWTRPSSSTKKSLW